MEIHICKDQAELTKRVTEWAGEKIKKYGARSLFLPAGNTPIPIYQKWSVEPPEFLKAIRFLQIDEILSGQGRGQFRRFFERHLPTFQGQFQWIDQGESAADMALLGLGQNGHVAFHEPHLPPEFYSGCVWLCESTKAAMGLAGEVWGVTYGLSSFKTCKAIAIIVTGEKKREVLLDFLRGDQTLPASNLLDHPDIKVFCDQEAYQDCSK